MLGASEYVADAVAEFLRTKDKPSKIHLEPDLADIPQKGIWLVITSTHGAGDLPDNIQPFAKQISGIELSSVSFAVIALGDSSYDTYCEGGKTMQQLLLQANASALSQLHTIDVLEHSIPEDNAVEWLQHIYQDTIGAQS